MIQKTGISHRVVNYVLRPVDEIWIFNCASSLGTLAGSPGIVLVEQE
jgi:hypothetical protein